MISREFGLILNYFDIYISLKTISKLISENVYFHAFKINLNYKISLNSRSTLFSLLNEVRHCSGLNRYVSTWNL